MQLLLNLLTILLSFYVMAKVVDNHFIKSLDNIAALLKLTPSVAGATLLALGTSAPEISTSLFALFLPNSNPATGLGTVVGSAIFQILVVIGFASLVKTTYLNWKPVIRDGAFYSITIILLITFVQDNQLTFIEASILVGTYLIYLLVLFLWSRYVPEESEPDPIKLATQKVAPPENRYKFIFRYFSVLTYPIDFVLSLIPDCEKKKKYTFFVFILSLVLIAGASYFSVVSAESIALYMGVPPAIIALTILAGGTSVPELISSAIVAKQGRGDMAISNAIGSNVFDILMSLGLPILIYTAFNGTITDIGGENIKSSILLLFATLISVLSLLAVQKFKIGRRFGLVLIFLYCIYVLAAYGGWL
ncbi:MAG: calcium/sodium antiporter [Patescibacteria group bacterium]